MNSDYDMGSIMTSDIYTSTSTLPHKFGSAITAATGTSSFGSTVFSNTMPTGTLRGSTGTYGPYTDSLTEISTEFEVVKDDVIAIKKILIELAKDENLLERNVVIRDILSEWLIKGLKK